MPSAAGKRVGRVLAGCSKPEAGDKPELHYLARILGSSRYLCIGQHECSFETHPRSDVNQACHRSRRTLSEPPRIVTRISSGTEFMNQRLVETQKHVKSPKSPFSSLRTCTWNPRIRLLFPWVRGSPGQKAQKTVEIGAFHVDISTQARTGELRKVISTELSDIDNDAHLSNTTSDRNAHFF